MESKPKTKVRRRSCSQPARYFLKHSIACIGSDRFIFLRSRQSSDHIQVINIKLDTETSCPGGEDLVRNVSRIVINSPTRNNQWSGEKPKIPEKPRNIDLIKLRLREARSTHVKLRSRSPVTNCSNNFQVKSFLMSSF